jgi:hypothetical protein
VARSRKRLRMSLLSLGELLKSEKRGKGARNEDLKWGIYRADPENAF